MSLTAESLRDMLRVGRVAVRIGMPSGECWALLVAVHRDRAITVSVTGILVRVPLRDVREATPSR
ncbi:MAG: hypothetical protein U0325_35200 [Polyangiales bacterium]